MERFIFGMNTELKDIEKAKDPKAYGAWETAGEIINDIDKNIGILVMVSFEIGSKGGVTFFELAQFIYDNYSPIQIAGLHMAISGNSAVQTMKTTYSSQEELDKIREDARKKNEESEKFLKGE